jgi:hypothetical protein
MPTTGNTLMSFLVHKTAAARGRYVPLCCEMPTDKEFQKLVKPTSAVHILQFYNLVWLTLRLGHVNPQHDGTQIEILDPHKKVDKKRHQSRRIFSEQPGTPFMTTKGEKKFW